MPRTRPHVRVKVFDMVSLEAHTKEAAKKAILAFVILGALALVIWKGPDLWTFLADQITRFLAWVWAGIWTWIIRPILNFLGEVALGAVLVVAALGLLGVAESHASKGRSREIHGAMSDNPGNTFVFALCLGAIIAWIAMTHGFFLF